MTQVLAQDTSIAARDGYQLAATVTTFRAHIYYIVRHFYHIQVMFYYQDGIAPVHQPV